jgi:hypothetical protein
MGTRNGYPLFFHDFLKTGYSLEFLNNKLTLTPLLTIRFWIEFAELEMLAKNRNLRKVS